MRAVYVILVVAAAAAMLRANDKPEPDIGEFKMGKVNLTTKIEEFKKLYPTAKKGKDSDAKLGTEVYSVEAEGMAALNVQFLDGMPILVTGMWRDKELEKVGGYKTILDKIKDKYGKAHVDSPGVKTEKSFEAALMWKNKAQTKLLVFMVTERYCAVNIANAELADKLNERKRKLANTGIGD